MGYISDKFASHGLKTSDLCKILQQEQHSAVAAIILKHRNPIKLQDKLLRIIHMSFLSNIILKIHAFFGELDKLIVALQ
ncbi:hypothetical protein D3C74_313260 [compost metagenome]